MYKVLIVDDDRNYRFAIRDIINWNEFGFEIADEAINGSQALRKINEFQYDLIITDMSMPLMNGVELIKTVKQKLPHVKFVALSAYDDFSFVKESLKAGAMDYILKYEMSEIEIENIIIKIKKILDDEKQQNKKNMIWGNKEITNIEIKRALIYMQEHFAENISLQEVADFVGLNKNYFSNLFKEETRQNFTKYLNHLRVEKAKELLVLGKFKNYEIAEMVGYSNTNYLSRVFKEIHGSTIEEYRKIYFPMKG